MYQGMFLMSKLNIEEKPLLFLLNFHGFMFNQHADQL